MPTNGRLVDWYCLEYKLASDCSVSESGDGDPIYGHSASLLTQYVPDIVNIDPGIGVEMESGFDGTSGVWAVTVSIGGTPVLVDGAASWLSSLSVDVRLYGVRLYGRSLGSALRIEIDTVKVSVNGGAESTVATGISTDGAATGPNYVTYIGMPPLLSWSASADRINVPSYTFDPCDPGSGAMSWSTSAASTCTGGWRLKETAGSSWVEVPVSYRLIDPPSLSGCPYGLSLGGVVSGSQSASMGGTASHSASGSREYQGVENGSLVRYWWCSDIDGNIVSSGSDGACTALDKCTGLSTTTAWQAVYQVASDVQDARGTVMSLPNLERTIEFLGEGGHAVYYRGELPAAIGNCGKLCSDGAVSVSDDNTVEVYPWRDYIVSTADDTSHVIFTDAFPATIYAPTTAQKSREYHEYTETYLGVGPILPSHSGITCPDGSTLGVSGGTTLNPHNDTVDRIESIVSEFPTECDPYSSAQSHNEALPCYLGSYPCPHWHLFYLTNNWAVDGAPVDWADYWGLIREQHLNHAALPPSEARLTRNHIIGSPLENEQGNTPWLDSYANGYRWIGVSRFQVLESTLSSSLTMSTSNPGSWASRIQSGTADCTVTTGAGGITLSSFNVPTAYVDLALAQWSNAPYLLLLRAKQVTAAWSATNVSAISVHLVAVDGAESAALATVSGSTFDVPRGTPGKYAGSWAYDWGALAVTDTGTDDQASGDSSTAMSDPLRMTGSMLGSDQTWQYLRFKVTPTNTALNVSLNWPVFTLFDTHPELVWESGKYCSLVWANGPAIRWGTQTWYISGLGFQDPPVSSAPGTANTWIDGMSYRYRVLEGSGGTLTTTLPTDLSSMFDTFEGQSIGTTDPSSHSWILPKGSDEKVRIALVNSYSEFPPMPCFPYRKRSTSTWAASGDFAQVVYDQVQETRKLISPKRSFILSDSGASVGGALTAPSNWFIWGYAPQLGNEETDFHVRAGTTNYATIRPWHGFYWTGGESASGSGGLVSMDAHPDGLRYRSLADGAGVITVQKSTRGGTWSNVGGLAGYAHCLRIDKSAKDAALYCVVCTGTPTGDIAEYVSVDGGRTFTLSTTIASGSLSNPAMDIERDGVRYTYWVDGTAVKGIVRDKSGANLGSSFTAIATVDSGSNIACRFEMQNGGSRRIVIQCVVSGAITEYVSQDGKTFV